MVAWGGKVWVRQVDISSFAFATKTAKFVFSPISPAARGNSDKVRHIAPHTTFDPYIFPPLFSICGLYLHENHTVKVVALGQFYLENQLPFNFHAPRL